jgi:hypothetical protein
MTGCLEPSAKVTKLDDAQTLANALVYVKAKNGLCFGVGTTSRMSTNATLVYSNCAAVGIRLGCWKDHHQPTFLLPNDGAKCVDFVPIVVAPNV